LGAEFCRLFLRLPATIAPAALDALLANPLTASVLLPSNTKADATARALVKRIQSEDRPALVRDDADLRAALEADGVHLSDAGAVAALRRKLGDGLIIGAECPVERHACMEAAENGADYVAVRVTESNRAAAMELLAWWQEMMTVPIVALLDDADDRAAMATHADFVSPPET
jgi:thiamine-phosphate pyrophosphorylase